MNIKDILLTLLIVLCTASYVGVGALIYMRLLIKVMEKALQQGMCSVPWASKLACAVIATLWPIMTLAAFTTAMISLANPKTQKDS